MPKGFRFRQEQFTLSIQSANRSNDDGASSVLRRRRNSNRLPLPIFLRQRLNCCIMATYAGAKWKIEAVILAHILWATAIVLITWPGAHPNRTDWPLGAAWASSIYRFGPSGAA
jgi:hypothetical protein